MMSNSAAQWDFEIRWARGGWLQVSGELDAHAIEAVEGMLRPRTGEVGPPLRVNLSRLRFVDLSAARRLARIWLAWGQGGQPRLLLVGAPARVRRAFALLGLEYVLEEGPQRASERLKGFPT